MMDRKLREFFCLHDEEIERKSQFLNIAGLAKTLDTIGEEIYDIRYQLVALAEHLGMKFKFQNEYPPVELVPKDETDNSRKEELKTFSTPRRLR